MKRLLDIVVSGAGLICLSPLFLYLCLKIRRELGKPHIFRQPRVGLNGQIFILYKFRSMTDGRDCAGELLPDEERLTPFSFRLRESSLDELPTLFNVLKGDMSLVGPRPLLVEYLPLYSDRQARRHEVKPGVTGWAQINGRNSVSWDRKFELDVWYVDNWSLLFDLKIILMTFRKVLVKEGISADDCATVPKFSGNSNLGQE